MGIKSKSGLWGFQNPVSVAVLSLDCITTRFLLGLESGNVTKEKLTFLKTHSPLFSEQISPCLQSLSSDSATNSRGAHFVPWDWMCSSTGIQHCWSPSSESQTGFATPPYELPTPRVTRSLPTVVETFKESFFIIEILFYKQLATFCNTPN